MTVHVCQIMKAMKDLKINVSEEDTDLDEVVNLEVMYSTNFGGWSH